MSSSHYCIWGSCNSQEYCCGDNVCCKEANYNALFLTAIIFGTITIIVLYCVYICCNYRRIYNVSLKKYFSISYNLMPTPQENKVESAINQESRRENYVVQM